MKSVSAFFCALLFGSAAFAADRPNIVFILADDLGYGDLSCYNPDSKISTPNLDSLAKQGLRFTDGHSPDSICTPSRYGILTGRYPFRSRLKGGVLRPWDPPLIDPGILTVPEFLKSAGYATAAVGKWHLGWEWATKDGKPPSSTDGLGNIDFTKPIGGGPITKGFDSFFGVDLPNYPPYVFIQNDHSVGIPSVPAKLQKGRENRPGPELPGWDQTEILPEVTRHAVRYLENAGKGPFFLYFALTAPHYPVLPTPEFRGKSKAGEYGDYVTEVDAMVGKVLETLEKTGLAKSTLVIFCSDNGPEVVEVDPAAYERIRLYGHSSMGVLRGAKRDAWEGGHRVPFIIRWPGRVEPGTSEVPIDAIDLMATCSAILDKPLPAGAGEDSTNILPVLLGKKLDDAALPMFIVHSANNHLGVRQGDWVFIDAKSGSGNGKGAAPAWFNAQRGYVDDAFPGELYNLKDDLSERHNLYGEHPEIVQRLSKLLVSYEAAAKKDPAHSQASIPTE